MSHAATASAGHMQRYAIPYAGLGFTAGLVVGGLFSFATPLASLLDAQVELYENVVPLSIFLILTPTLLKLAQQEDQDTRAPLWMLLWFASVRLWACLFALIAVSLAFSLSWVPPDHAQDLTAGMQQVGESLWATMRESHYFWAIYASLLGAGLLSKVRNRFTRLFMRVPELIEDFGSLFTSVVPLFTFLVGVYVVTLPAVLNETFAGLPEGSLHAVPLFGAQLSPDSPGELLTIYVALALLTGAISSAWHLVLLGAVRRRMPTFDLKRYLSAYFFRIYPLLWATSSEALSMPLNLHLVREAFPSIPKPIRHLAVTVGSIFNINGTLTCCLVITPAVCLLIGHPVSALSLVFCLPVIYIVGFGVPGIPGELVLFAGPIMAVLDVPPEQQPIFLLSFVGLQIGLPDSFRTGANSTDDCPSALLLHCVAQERATS